MSAQPSCGKPSRGHLGLSLPPNIAAPDTTDPDTAEGRIEGRKEGRREGGREGR